MSHNIDYKVTPIEIVAQDIGAQLNAYRISRGFRTEDLAAEMGVSRPTLARLLAGENTSFSTLIRALSALGLVERLDLLVPDVSESPLAKLEGGAPIAERKRVRAGGKNKEQPWTWGDDDQGDGV